jgi:soluble lytic murein transglycosylase
VQQAAPEWRYWLAVALQKNGREQQALPLFDELAKTRSYFGFLAADELGTEYAFEHAATPKDEAIIAGLAHNPALIRARELFYVGLESRGRAEWKAAVARLDPDGLTQAAVLANRWHWHSQAIATVAETGRYDDLAIRYPLAYEPEFLEYSEAANIRGSWAWGVARSESLFMADVRSHAGAIGVMQLMPATARRTAADLKLPYSGLKTLTDPKTNIRLGTAYLAEMLKRFGGNVVLATAAYNAGPHKVEEWLPESERLDARIWIENIPYNETRRFVRRVLEADAIFHWRLTGESGRLSAALRDVDPPEPGSKPGRRAVAGG